MKADKMLETLVCSDLRRQPLANKYPIGYNCSMFTVFRTDEFDEWLSKLRDAKGKARIIARIRSAELGNLGDVEPVGEGVREMRVHWPGIQSLFHKER
jgi:putative component of toxin-antitoxin plasmid stabilization module